MAETPPPDPKERELALKRHELIQREYQILGDYLKEARSPGVTIGSMRWRSRAAR